MMIDCDQNFTVTSFLLGVNIMPKAAPVQNEVFNAAYEALSEMRSDGYVIPHYNSSATLSIYPGEPFLKKQGAGFVVCIAQSLIKPGEWKSVLRTFRALFPCNVSADVEDGDAVYWSVSGEEVILAGDAAIGDFLLGYATWSAKPGEVITAVADDYPVVATSESTHIEVVHGVGVTTVEPAA